MSHFIRVTGIVVALTLLLAVTVAPVQAHRAGPRPNEAASVSTDTVKEERAEDTPLVCLALVGGTALLAGGVWIRKLRSTLS